MALFGKKRKRDSDSVPDLPRLDLALTVVTGALFVGDAVALAKEGREVTIEFVVALVATTVAIRLCKAGFLPLGRRLSTAASLAKSRNLRKFCDQSWQLVVHAAMTWYEYRLLQDNWSWWTDSKTMWKREYEEEPCSPALRRLYIMQLAIWFATAFSHKFMEAKHKDYFVMYGHHVATLCLVTISYFNGWTPVGLVVLFLHDSSDIIADLLKMVNYLGLDGSSGTFLTEAFFVMNLITWFVCRLWWFPRVIYSSFREYWKSIPFPAIPAGDSASVSVAGQACRLLLIVLFFMHIWWYCLFLRILYRLLAGQGGHQAGGAEYEGSSDSEAEDSPKAEGRANGKSDGKKAN